VIRRLARAAARLYRRFDAWTMRCEYPGCTARATEYDGVADVRHCAAHRWEVTP